MTDYTAEARELAGCAGRSPHGPLQVAVWEQAIALADAHDDDDLGFLLRSAALWPMYHGNRAELLLVIYAWCLAYLDRNPNEDVLDTLWSYRWVVDKMAFFPSISRAQVDAAWTDMKSRYERSGFSVRPIWLNRRVHLCHLGDEAAATDAQKRYRRAAVGLLSDSPSVEASFAVTYESFLGRDAEAAQAAKPFLSGKINDDVFVNSVANKVVLPLTRLGRLDEARDIVERSTRVTSRAPQYLGRADESLTFYTVTGDLATAARHFDLHFVAATVIAGEFHRLTSYKHALFFARELVSHNRKLQLKVPEGLIPGVTGTRATPGQLRDWLEIEYPALCAKADARNGNSYYTDHLADLDDYQRLARKLA